MVSSSKVPSSEEGHYSLPEELSQTPGISQLEDCELFLNMDEIMWVSEYMYY